MPRSVARFTGQRAGLPLETVAKKASSWHFDGLELAVWGEHFEAEVALETNSYSREKRGLLETRKVRCRSISTHFVGRCVSDDRLDDSHQYILPPRIRGNGKAEEVPQRCAEEVKKTARAGQLMGIGVINRFAGSPTCAKLYLFPPTSQENINVGNKDFAERRIPILDEHKKERMIVALDVHPTETARNFIKARRMLNAQKELSFLRICLRSQPPHPPDNKSCAIQRRVPETHLQLSRQGFEFVDHRLRQHPWFTSGLRRLSVHPIFCLAGARRHKIGA